MIEDGCSVPASTDGVTLNKKTLKVAENKMYKRHRMTRNIMVNTLPFLEFTKIVDKSTVKSIYDSFCNMYKGNQQVKEAKSNMLIQQYELFKMRTMRILKPCFPGQILVMTYRC
ncbi:hypothetical protein MTR_5g070400 [Medicago truncatula]|uniref:Uncharacterized protein n=1 Tax=Medicago truncatula TaxID=3880 RepID=G7KE55_MEDTR|nr:hypothetical protein MTR_5g070400 [Medicago truncatula]